MLHITPTHSLTLFFSVALHAPVQVSCISQPCIIDASRNKSAAYVCIHTTLAAGWNRNRMLILLITLRPGINNHLTANVRLLARAYRNFGKFLKKLVDYNL